MTDLELVQYFEKYDANTEPDALAQPPTVTVDLDEGQFAEVCCLQCRHEAAVIAMARPVRMYVLSLNCRNCECGAPLVEYHQFSGRAAR